MEEALIQYKNVEIHQQELCVLSDVNLELHKGEFVYLIGKVGSGKTSLLKTFYGELDVIDGEAEVLGYNMRSIKRKHIPQLRRKLGIVFQDFQLLTDRTVYNNLEFVLRATGWKNKREIQERIEEVLDLVGMSNKGYKTSYSLALTRNSLFKTNNSNHLSPPCYPFLCFPPFLNVGSLLCHPQPTCFLHTSVTNNKTTHTLNIAL